MTTNGTAAHTSTIVQRVVALLKETDEALTFEHISKALPDANVNSLGSALYDLARSEFVVKQAGARNSHNKPVNSYVLTEKGRNADLSAPILPSRRSERQAQPAPAALAPATPLPYEMTAELVAGPQPTLIKVGSYRFGANHIVFTDESSVSEVQVTLDLSEWDLRTNKRHNKVLRFQGDEARQLRACLNEITINCGGDQGEELERLRGELAAAEQLASESEEARRKAEAELAEVKERARKVLGL